MAIMQLERMADIAPDGAWVSWPGRACCCTAQPMVRVVLPPSGAVDHAVDLFLCGHHYRAAREVLWDTGASVTARDASAVSW